MIATLAALSLLLLLSLMLLMSPQTNWSCLLHPRDHSSTSTNFFVILTWPPRFRDVALLSIPTLLVVRCIRLVEVPWSYILIEPRHRPTEQLHVVVYWTLL